MGNDEAYEPGVHDGQRGDLLEDLAQSISSSGSTYDKGYNFGATHRFGSEGRYHTWDKKGSNDPKPEEEQQGNRATSRVTPSSGYQGSDNPRSWDKIEGNPETGCEKIVLNSCLIIPFLVFMLGIGSCTYKYLQESAPHRLFKNKEGVYEREGDRRLERRIERDVESAPLTREYEPLKINNNGAFIETKINPKPVRYSRPLVYSNSASITAYEKSLVSRVFDLREPDWRRAEAVRELSDYPYGRIAKVLAEKVLSQDKSYDIRKETAKTLGFVGNEQFIPYLERTVNNLNEHYYIRVEAQNSIARIRERVR